MKISPEDVKRVADLANLDLSAEESALYLNQLDAILTYIEKLKKLDVTGVQPMAQAIFAALASSGSAGSGLRDDVPRPCDVAPAALKQAPDASAPFFRVPKVIER